MLVPPTIKEKIIVHLSRYPPSKYEDEPVPYQITQEGIGEAVGAPRNYVAVVLGRMEKRGEGLVFCDTRYVVGHKKKKVYFLTSKGFEEAKKILERFENSTVRIIMEDRKVLHISFKELKKYLGERDAYVKGILMMDDSGTISLLSGSIKGLNVFVGRKEYTSRFKTILREGNKKCIFITGSAGVGKTTLALKLGEEARTMGFSFLVGRCYEDMDVPYYPMISLFGGYKDPMANKLIRILKKDSKISVENSSVVDAQRRAMWGDVTRLIGRMAEKHPLVLFIDDLQWSDRSTLLMIEFICKYSENMPFIFIFTYLTEDAKEQNIRAILEEFKFCNPLEFSLNPLSIEETHQFLTTLLKKDISEDILQRVQEITGGNPLFITEVVDSIRSKGLDSGSFQVDDLSVPSRLEGLILQKIMNLRVSTIDVLRVASVLGSAFSLKLLQRITGKDSGTILRSIDELVETGILTVNEQGLYTFSHPLIHLTVYKNAPNKKEIHRKIAEFAEKNIGEFRDAMNLTNIGYHYERCGEVDKAVKYYTIQAEMAKRKLAYEDSISLLERALILSKKDNIPYASILQELAKLYSLRGKYEMAIKRYEDLLKIVDSDEKKQEIMLRIAQIYRQKGSFEDAMSTLENAFNLKNEVSSLKVQLLSEKFWMFLKSGKIFDAERTLQEMGEIALNLRDDVSLAIYYENMATINHYRGNVEDAIRYLNAEMNIRKKMNDFDALSTVYTNMGILLAQNGRIQDAIKYFKNSREIDEKIGNLRGSAQNYTNLGVAYHKLGFLKRAIKMFEEAEKIYGRIGSNDSLGIVHLNKGNVFKDMGNLSAAYKEIEKSAKIFEDIGDRWSLCHSYRSLGIVKLHEKKYIESICWVRRAIDMAKNTDNEKCLVESYADLSLLYMYMNEDDLAREILKRIDKLSRNFKDNYVLGERALLWGIFHYRNGDYRKALEFFHISYREFLSIEEKISSHLSLYYIGEMLTKMNNIDEGRKNVDRACRWFKNRDILHYADLCKGKE